MNFDFFEENTPTADIAETTELQDLLAVAKYIPCLKWQYDPNKIQGMDTETHLGIITQALKKVPGLASAVKVDENGVESFDIGYVAGAALALVAALARKTLGIELDEEYASNE